MKVEPVDAADFADLADCAAEVAEVLATLCGDIAVVVDAGGTVLRVAQDPRVPLLVDAERWVGQHWPDTASDGTRRKLELMLGDVRSTGYGRRREVTLKGSGGEWVPVAYTALRLGQTGPLVAAGRDLRAAAQLQQRFLDFQQEIERGYWRARQNESRYWLLFQVATDAVLTVEAQSLRVIEANQAAATMFSGGAGGLAGRVAAQQFADPSAAAVAELLRRAASSGQPGEVDGRVAGSLLPVSIAVAPFRAGDGLRLLLRVRAVDPTAAAMHLNEALSRLVDGTRDGVVVTDAAGHVVVANPAFVKLVGVESESQVRGRPLVEWIGRTESDVAALIGSVQGQGLVRLVRSSLRKRDGELIDVDVTAALLTEGDQECFGFTVTPCTAAALATPPRSALALAIDRLDADLGRRPLPEMLRQVEKLAGSRLLQLALDRVGGDVTQAATLLGISTSRLEELGNAAATEQG